MSQGLRANTDLQFFLIVTVTSEAHKLSQNLAALAAPTARQHAVTPIAATTYII